MLDRCNSKGCQTLRAWAFCTILIVLALVHGQASATHGGTSGEDPSLPQSFGGTYAELEPPQQRLVDDWYHRYSRVIGKTIEPETGFNQLPLSAKTTFQAVTHALMTSELTSEDGQSLGTALDVIEHVDTIRGRVNGKRGDLQFRIYARLNPQGVQMLRNSQEFKKRRRNLFLHRGYPHSHRQKGGTPSIQVSLARDELSADIDVDYRIPIFPISLFNGHYFSFNSDVRAANHYNRHVRRWFGLRDWWVNWFGLAFLRPDEEDEVAPLDQLALNPLVSHRRVQDAALEFLESWLVQRQPENAMGFFSKDAWACFVPDGDDPDPGMALYRVLASLKQMNRTLGTVSSLGDAVSAVRLASPGSQVVSQSHQETFFLYEVAEAEAWRSSCSGSAERADTRKGPYFQTVFQVATQDDRTESLALLWRKEGKHWKIAAFERDPGTELALIPDLTSPPVAPPTPVADGHPAVLQAAQAFLRSWLVDKDAERAVQYFADDGMRCAEVIFGTDALTDLDPAVLRPALSFELGAVAEQLESSRGLGDTIRAVEPADPEVSLVTHPDQQAFTVLRIPRGLDLGWGCPDPTHFNAPCGAGARDTDSERYVVAFQARAAGEDAPIVLTLWEDHGKGWQITSLDLETP